MRRARLVSHLPQHAESCIQYQGNYTHAHFLPNCCMDCKEGSFLVLFFCFYGLLILYELTPKNYISAPLVNSMDIDIALHTFQSCLRFYLQSLLKGFYVLFPLNQSFIEFSGQQHQQFPGICRGCKFQAVRVSDQEVEPTGLPRLASGLFYYTPRCQQRMPGLQATPEPASHKHKSESHCMHLEEECSISADGVWLPPD